MKPHWNGFLSFGLVNIPVRLYSPTASRELEFHLLHKKDLSPISYEKFCKKEGRPVEFSDLAHGYEYKKGHYVILSNSDFKKANARKTSTIDVLDFVRPSELDYRYFEKPFYLEPDGADKAYAILRDALKEEGKVGIAKFVFSKREHMGAVIPKDNLLMLIQMRFADEVQAPKGLKLPSEKLSGTREKEMALKLIRQFERKFNPAEYKDAFSAEIKSVITQKIKGTKLHTKGQVPAPTRINDLMASLKASLEDNYAAKTVSKKKKVR